MSRILVRVGEGVASAHRNVSSRAHGHPPSLCDTLQMPIPRVTIDDGMKKKCARVTLGCVTAEVQAQDAPAGIRASIGDARSL